MRRKPVNKTVTWIGEEILDAHKSSINFRCYEKLQFKSITAGIGDFVLVSNADSAEPDTEAGCDVARILSLYEDCTNNSDPFRAKVQWYSRPADLPRASFNNAENVEFLDKEVLEDHRPFDTDVSIETFFKKCSVTLTFTRDTDVDMSVAYHYVCRYRLVAVSKRKVDIEPVLEEERNAILLLRTPAKGTPSKTPKTPTSLIKRMGRVSISEQKNWSVSKNDGTKLLLKRAILADKNEKDSPKTPKKPLADTPKKPIADTPKKSAPVTPKSGRRVSKANVAEILSMELLENSDDELPTLIIRQHVPTTPKRKSSIRKSSSETPKKMLLFDDDDIDTPTTRSGRVKKHINYAEPELSPVKRTRRPSRASRIVQDSYMERTPTKDTPTKRTPRKSMRKTAKDDDEDLRPGNSRNLQESDEEFKPRKLSRKKDTDEGSQPRKSSRVDSDDDDDFRPTAKTPRTPRTPKTPRTPRATPGKTPKRKIISQLTPSLHTRAHSLENIDDFQKQDKSLPGREHQMEEILAFVRSKLLHGASGCMYISGVPGTGKTATVSAALARLKTDDVPAFTLVEVNGMRIAEPRQAYVHIYRQLTGKTVVWEQACALLEKRFTNPGPRRTPTVLLVDELDALCTRRQDVLYSVMEWAAHTTAQLTVLAVANTMDLPERALAARVASRLGLTRLTFPPYTHGQLQTIVAARLAGAAVTADAVQLIARKVAAVSGDARRALALCARAVELAGEGCAGLQHVQQALDEAVSSAAVRAIQCCAPGERLMLRAVAAEVERTGSDETTLSRALATAAAIVALDGRPYRTASIRPPTSSQGQTICARLAAQRLLLLEPKPNEPRLILNVSTDDVHYATRQICV